MYIIWENTISTSGNALPMNFFNQPQYLLTSFQSSENMLNGSTFVGAV
jgi:hypothetical protein